MLPAGRASDPQMDGRECVAFTYVLGGENHEEEEEGRSNNQHVSHHLLLLVLPLLLLYLCRATPSPLLTFKNNGPRL